MSAAAQASRTVAKAPAREAPAARPRAQIAAAPAPFQSAAGNLAVQAALGGTGLAGASSLSRPDDADERDAERKAELFVARHPQEPRGLSAYEGFFGADFSAVRIHTGEQAQSSARALNARAYAHGTDVVFGAGEFAPGTREGRRLLAHELAHVAQDRAPGRVRRQLLEAGATDEANDQRLTGILESQPGINPLNLAPQVDGLAGWRRRMPRSYAEMRRRSAASFGEPAVAAIESHDSEILALVNRSEAVQRGLEESRQFYEGVNPEDADAARHVIDYYGGEHYLLRDDVRGLYEVSYTYFAQQYADDIRYDLRIYQQILAGEAADIVSRVGVEAFAAAADARTAREQRGSWSETGAGLVGDLVAKREGIFLDDDLELESQLDPTYGGENRDDMLAIARAAGRMSAVVETGGRYYAYALSHNYDRTEIFLARDWDQASKLIEAGHGAGRAVDIATSDGFVVTLDRESGRYSGQYRTRDPLLDLEADTRLIETGEAERLGLDVPRLFLNMVRNLALENLRQAEQRMNGIVAQMAPQHIMDPTRGENLQRDTARLRQLTIDARRLGDEIGDNELTDDQAERRDELLAEMAQIVQDDPAAAFFVREQRHTLWSAVDVLSPDPGFRALGGLALEASGVPQTYIEDQLEGVMGGDAALSAMNEARSRIENVATVRRAMFDDPDVVLGFEPLHAAVLERFSPGQRAEIRRSLAWRDFRQTAATIGLAVLDLGMLIAGFFTGGATWFGLGLEAAGATLGIVQLDSQLRHASLVSAEAELDIPGGFRMASEEAAASARHWAILGAALTFLGMVGMARTASRLIRAAEEETTRVARIAERFGVSAETASAALRRSWRGVPNPDPRALREILLAGLPRELRARYADLPIQVLDEAEWARRFGANSADHAATQFASREGDIYATEVLFRRQGNVMALQEEAAHLAQSIDPRTMRQMHDIANIRGAWAGMSLLERMRSQLTVLELELDAQERVLARAQAAGDVEAMDDILAEMDDISRRMGELEGAIANPAGPSPRWFDPERAPTHLFNAPRLPREHGAWIPPGRPGNGTWMPEAGSQARTLAPNGVEFRNGYPNFRPWSQAEVRIGQTGLASDFADADLRFAQRVVSGDIPLPSGTTMDNFIHNGEAVAAGTQRYRRAAGLTWHHHQGGTVMLLVPRGLHGAVPHTGGASAARAAGG